MRGVDYRFIMLGEMAQYDSVHDQELRSGRINHPEQMTFDDRRRIRKAAFKVTRMYPGPVGEILSRELLAFEEFGYRFGSESLVRMLVDEIEKWRAQDNDTRQW